MKKIFLYVLVTGMILSGCSNNAESSVEGNINEKPENSFFSDNEETVRYEDSENSLTGAVNLISNDNYAYISDVSVMNNEIYISGSENSEICNCVISGETETKLSYSTFPVYYEFFQDKFYSFFESENGYINIDILSSDNEEIINTGLKGSYFKILNDSSFVMAGDEPVIYNWKLKSEIRASVSEKTKGNVCIETNSNGDIFLFYENEHSEKKLCRFDKSFNIVYNTGEFDDMFGTVTDLCFDDKGDLSLVTYDDENEIYFINTVNSESGKTTERSNIKDYNVTRNWQTKNGYVIDFKSEYKTNYSITVKDTAGSNIRKTDMISDNGGQISKVFVRNNSVYYIEESYNAVFITEEDSDQSLHIIHKIDENGNHSRISVDSYNDMSYTQFLAVDSNENYFITEKSDTEYIVYIYDKKGELINQVGFSNLVALNSCAVCDDNLFIYYTDTEERSHVNIINAESRNSEEYELDVSPYSELFSSADPGYLMLKDLNGVVKLDADSKVIAERYNMFNNSTSGYKLCHVSENVFLKYNDDECWMISDDGAVSSEEIVVGLSYLNDDISKAIDKYNNENPNSHISAVQYGLDKDTYNKINLDLIQGKIDIVVSDHYFDVEEYDKSIFADMSEFFSRDFDEEDYYTNIINLYRNNGKLYEIVPFYSLCCMIGYADVLPDADHWSFDDFINFNSKYGIGVTQYDIYDCLSGILFNSIEDNEVKISRNDFAEIIQSISDGYRGNDYEAEKVWCSEINKFGYSYTEKPDKSISYPSKFGKGIIVKPELGFSVINSSEHKNECWEFIKIFLEDKYQLDEDAFSMALPLNRKSCNSILSNNLINEEQYDNCIRMIENADSKNICEFNKTGIIISESVSKITDSQESPDEIADELINKINLFLKERE